MPSFLSREGLVVLDDLFLGQTFEHLRAEALALAGVAEDNRFEVDEAGEDRGGRPAMSLYIGPGGPMQTGVYHHETIRGLIERLAGSPVTPSSDRACFNFYRRPGDHMALHRDTDECDVTLITCLVDEGAPPDADSGALRAYPGRRDAPLSAIRRRPAHGAVTIRLKPGQSLLMLGGVVAHAVTPVAPGQQRIASALCYRLG